MTKKALALLMSVVMLVVGLSACASRKQPAPEIVTQKVTKVVADTNSFKLSYSQSDSLNPFEADTLNNQVIEDLVFEPLFRLDENFDVVPEIASSYSYVDATTLKVTIVSGLKFSNGDTLEASDVVSSFEKAKSSPHWKNSLEAISSASVNTSSSVIFNLKYPDPYAHRLLTFYIAKTKDNKKYPIGSGRYIFDDGNTGVKLVLNKNYKEEFNPRFTSISLVNVPATDSINNALNIGNISFAFRDLSNEDVARLKINKKAVNLNNMVFIGLNSNYGVTYNKYIRQAISLAVDRTTIAKSSYQGFAKQATSIYNPSTKLGMQTKIFSATADSAAAKQAIIKSGYSEDKLNVSLLVKESNANMVATAMVVAQSLEAVGFKVDLKIYNDAQYKDCLKYNSYNIYIGETKLPDDMRLNSFLRKKGATSYGIDTNSKTAKVYASYLKGESAIGDFTLKFSEEMPFVPLVYRQGIICYSKAMHGDVQGYYGNYFSNIEDWYYN